MKRYFFATGFILAYAADAYSEVKAPTLIGYKADERTIELRYMDNSDRRVNFKIERDGEELGLRGDLDDGEVGTYKDWSVKRGTSYRYRIRAYDVKTSELSPYSEEVIARLAGDPPSPPDSSPPSEEPKPPTTPPPEQPKPEPPAEPKPPTGNRILVKTADDLRAALLAVKPGQTIELADGTYAGKFTGTAKASLERPIILSGTHRAVLDGGSTKEAGYVLHLKGAEYWRIEGITVTNGQKGVILDNASFNVLDRIIVHTVGDEAVHFRANSSYNVIKGSFIHNTGKRKPGYGEGVYIGSAQSNMKNDKSDYNSVIDNMIGPNVTAEHIDAKEYSSHGLISGNKLNGDGQTSENFTVSSVFIKGNDYIVRGNVVSNPREEAFRVNVITKGVSGDRNLFEKNYADVVHKKGYGFNIVKGEGNVVKCDNVVENAKAFSNVKCVP